MFKAGRQRDSLSRRPGYPMGELMRQYWIPALPSAEFPAPDSPPKRMKLLGENLVMFRDSTGEMGCFVESCPHRGASMFFGRNEEAGLRCGYHGWKFDTTGACVDMPSEPGRSRTSRARCASRPIPAMTSTTWSGSTWASVRYRRPSRLSRSTPCRRRTSLLPQS